MSNVSAPPEWDRLLSASQKNDVDLVRRVIEEEGVSPSHSNRAGQSALHVAALWGHGKCVLLLLLYIVQSVFIVPVLGSQYFGDRRISSSLMID
jgi:Ankyrin repeats (many copies)